MLFLRLLRSDFPNQINNAMVFPALFRGLFDNNINKVTDEINLGDEFDVKYFGIDSKTKKQKVSRKALLPRPDRKN